MGTLIKRLQNYLPDAIYNQGNQDLPEHLEYERFWLFETERLSVRILVVDQFANPIVMLPEASIHQTLEILFNSLSGKLIDIELDSLLSNTKRKPQLTLVK